MNDKYKISNLKFFEEKYKPDVNLFKNKKNLCIARMALAYLNPSEIEIFLSKLYSSNVDIAISDVGRFRLNKDSKVSYTQSGVSVFSHPYEKLLSRIGYSIVIDMQKSQALMNFTTYMFPEYHIMIYGVKKNNS